MPNIPKTLTTRLGFLLLKAHRGVKRWADAELASIGVSTSVMGILECLQAEPGMSQAEVCAVLDIDRTSMGQAVLQLEGKGLVERRLNADDQRSYALQLTAEGTRQAREASRLARSAQRKYLHALSASEQEQLISLLRRLVEADLR